MSEPPKKLPAKKAGSWVQTDRSIHELWAQLSFKYPAAAAILHFLTGRVGEHNAVVVGQKTVADILGMSLSTAKRGFAALEKGNWVEKRQIGVTGSINAYVLNERVAWHRARDDRRYALFSAQVVVAADDQPDKDELGQQEPLQRLPRVHPGEGQLPSGEGLPPPSQPALPGMEPDLPEMTNHARNKALTRL
jgi:hypothetical protein